MKITFTKLNNCAGENPEDAEDSLHEKNSQKLKKAATG